MNMSIEKLQHTFILEGEMPSKKNSWSRNAQGQVYIPAKITGKINDFLWQLKSIRVQMKLWEPWEFPVEVVTEFHGSVEKDLDNITTTLLDILQKAHIIKNDKQVRILHVEKCEGKRSKVEIKITPIVFN